MKWSSIILLYIIYMKLVKLVKLFEKHMCLILSFVLICILCVSLANSGMLPEHFEGEEDVPTCCLFHADWCPHCTKFLPEWNKFKKTHGSKCKIIDIEAKDKETMKKHGISGYPTIKFLPNGLSSPEGSKEYDGERNIDSLAKFVDENVTEKFSIYPTDDKDDSKPNNDDGDNDGRDGGDNGDRGGDGGAGGDGAGGDGQEDIGNMLTQTQGSIEGFDGNW
jgi:thiol-disulfide isomerase/thioredoxin